MEYQERKWVWGFAVVVMVATTIPYILALFNQGENWQFSGFLLGVEDGNSYTAKMLAGANGDWLFRTPYTNFPQQGVLAFFPYLLLGKLTAGVGQHAQLIALFHIYRFIAGCLMIGATYDFTAIFIEKVFFRKLSTILISIGGGFGWLVVLGLNRFWANGMPLEFYSPETFGFLSLYGLPHLALGRACLLWGLCAVFDGNHPFRKIQLAGLYYVLLALLQPVTAFLALVLLVMATTGFVVQNWINLKNIKLAFECAYHQMRTKLFWICIVAVPFILYILITYSSNPFVQLWEEQNIITSPPLIDYLLAYGWAIPFIVFAVLWMLNRKIIWQPFLLSWILFLPILIYAPVNIQRRLAEGGWVTIVILVVIVLEKWNVSKKYLVGLAILFSLSSIIILADGFRNAINPQNPIFRTNEEVELFGFIDSVTSPNDVVLASYELSNPLPAWAAVRVVIGHGPESIEGKETNLNIQKFYSGKYTEKEEIQFLKKYRVSYVVWSPVEQKIGVWNPYTNDCLKSVYQSGDYSVFQVISQ